MVDLFTFAVLALSVWRVSHMVAIEDGPGDIFRRLRGLAGATWTPVAGWTATGLLGRVVICPLCSSVWLAALFYLVVIMAPSILPIFVVLAASGVACLLEQGVSR